MEQNCGKALKIWILRALLTALCLCMLAFIFGNSLQTGEQSSGLSRKVTDAVQKLCGLFAPESWIATATGEAYDKLHGIVRTAAHFSEFALLGALFCWCYRAYTRDKTFLFLPVGLLVLVPIVDEFLQRSSADRIADIADMLVDTAGGLCGFSFALLTLLIGFICKRKKEKKYATGKYGDSAR